MPTIGAVADDYTGATDLATTLVSRGYRTMLSFGVPPGTGLDPQDFDAVVIGLKIRSAPVDTAVTESVAAVQYLRRIGCRTFYDKYCATFDSTPEGNIGPVLDALMDELGVDRSVVVLPFPEAGRTMYSGHLFVHGTPLDETSMRHHPLTPMTDSRILRVLEPQTHRTVTEIRHDTVTLGSERIREALAGSGPSIAVIDAISRADLDAIAAAVAEMPLVSGGAGLAASFAPVGESDRPRVIESAGGFSAVLAGSASAESQRQIADAQPTLPSRKLSPAALRDDFDAAVGDLARWAADQWRREPGRPVLVYSVGEPGDVDLTAHPDGLSTAELTERALAACAQAFAERGLRQLIVAGGETSGSVTNALGISTFDVGSPLSPGIAWAACSDRLGHPMAVLLKSGSLGTVDLFTQAWTALASPAQ